MGRILCSVVTERSKEYEEYIINTDTWTGTMMNTLNVAYIATISHSLKEKIANSLYQIDKLGALVLSFS